MIELCAPGAHDLKAVPTTTASAFVTPPVTYCTKCGLGFGGTMHAATVAPNGIAAISLPMVVATGTAA